MNRFHLPLLAVILLLSCNKEEEIINTVKECVLTEEQIEIVSELDIHEAIPFNSSDPDISETELNPLLDYLSTATIVGLGEATHGSAEFFQMKDKIFRALVQDKGFDAIIFEIPWGNCLRVNDFVVNGKGTADSSIDQTWYWVYDTEETRALADWMRNYNIGMDSINKIHFVGCDPQGPSFEIEVNHLYRYFEKYAPVIKDSAYVKYVDLPYELTDYNLLPKEDLDRNRTNVSWVYDYLKQHREAFVSLSGAYEYQVALMASHVIKHREDMYRRQNFGQTRDSLMAIYSLWWQKILGPDSKVAVWAHNAHVMDNNDSFGEPWMGAHLRDSLSSDYINVAFSFTYGGMNAFVANQFGNFHSYVQEQELIEPECRTTNYLFSQLNYDQFYIIFKNFDPGLTAYKYLFERQPFYQMGAGFNPKYMHNYTRNYDLPDLWDVVIHFDTVQATRLK